MPVFEWPGALCPGLEIIQGHSQINYECQLTYIFKECLATQKSRYHYLLKNRTITMNLLRSTHEMFLQTLRGKEGSSVPTM